MIFVFDILIHIACTSCTNDIQLDSFTYKKSSECMRLTWWPWSMGFKRRSLIWLVSIMSEFNSCKWTNQQSNCCNDRCSMYEQIFLQTIDFTFIDNLRIFTCPLIYRVDQCKYQAYDIQYLKNIWHINLLENDPFGHGYFYNIQKKWEYSRRVFPR